MDLSVNLSKIYDFWRFRAFQKEKKNRRMKKYAARKKIRNYFPPVFMANSVKKKLSGIVSIV